MAKKTVPEGQSSKLELMHQLYQQGVDVGPEVAAKLVAAGYIQAQDNENNETVSLKSGEAVRFSMADVTRSTLSQTAKQTLADKHVFIIYADVKSVPCFADPELVISHPAYERAVKKAKKETAQVIEITDDMWRPASKLDHTPEFVAWIDSINRPDGFWNSTRYRPYELYCKQAQQWLEEETPEITDEEELLEYRINEAARCKENTLYAVDKYGELKESNKFGMHKYVAAKAHKILLYLLDCGYSLDIVKARQIAFTTTIAFWILIKAMFNFNYNAKFISENKIKAEDTLENRVKYPHSKFPIWLQHEARNDRMQRIVFGEKGEKGEREGVNSSIEVLPPGKTAIASTTPDATLIDEAGNIEILNDILSDNLPTQYGFNPETQRLELLRQIILWGTGGYMEKAGIAFKTVFMAHWTAWEERNFSSGIIPLFFNNWYKPGMDQATYEELKKQAYAGEGPKAAESRIRFHQGFPITLEDVFLQGGKTLLDMDYIQGNLDRIAAKRNQVTPDYGFFEPVYDYTKPAHEGSDVPYEIIGANWIPCKLGDDRVTTMIFLHPKKWINRYYQGTDPIASDNGHSKMSSTIWDDHFGTPSACLNFRTNNYRYVFLQTILLGIYYNVENNGAAQELIESNNGTAYREYKENKGLVHSLVYSTELPQVYQTKKNTVLIGLDNKGHRNTMVINDMRNVFETFGDRIWLPVYFNQLKTFVCKQKGQGDTWEPADKKHNWDDTLFSLVYAYLCAQVYAHRKPESLEGDRSTVYVRQERKLVRDSNGHLTYISKNEYNRRKQRSNAA